MIWSSLASNQSSPLRVKVVHCKSLNLSVAESRTAQPRGSHPQALRSDTKVKQVNSLGVSYLFAEAQSTYFTSITDNQEQHFNHSISLIRLIEFKSRNIWSNYNLSHVFLYEFLWLCGNFQTWIVRFPDFFLENHYTRNKYNK